MSIEDALKSYEGLVKAGKVSFLELEVLLAFVLGKERDELIRDRSDKISKELFELFKTYIERLEQGEPVAYILQNKEFYGLNFFVDKRVLVPRPETEGLVNRAITYFQNNKDEIGKFSLIDVGTGSGNIIISIVKECERIELDVIEKAEAVDISEDALDVARLNAEQLGVEDRIHFYQSNLLEEVPKGSKYNLILANLPYIGESKNNFVEKNVEKYEPSVALFGGEDGLSLYNKMFQQLKDEAISFDLMMGEIGFSQRNDLSSLLDKYFEQSWAIDQDFSGLDRFFIVKGKKS